MLHRLGITDLALIEDLALDFGPGLNVVSGETGAGKSLLQRALALAAGHRAGNEVVRRDAEAARITAVFDLPPRSPAAIRLAEIGVPGTDGGRLEVSSTVSRAGRGLVQLNGKTVATTTGTTSVQTLRKHEKAAGVDFKEVYGKDHADSFLLLESGRADAFVMDGSILAANIAKSKAPADFKIVGEVLSVEPIACMMRKDDPAFKKAVDDSIKGMIKSGDLAKLYDKWFMQPVPPTNTKIGLPMSEATKAAWAAPNDKPMEDYAKK